MSNSVIRDIVIFVNYETDRMSHCAPYGYKHPFGHKSTAKQSRPFEIDEIVSIYVCNYR